MSILEAWRSKRKVALIAAVTVFARVPPGLAAELVVTQHEGITLAWVLDKETNMPTLYRLYFACIKEDEIAALAEAPSGCPKGTGANPVVAATSTMEELRRGSGSNKSPKPASK